MTQARRVVILGGGVAGLAAAFQLVSRGLTVELFESRSRLGGRAFSFEDARYGAELDNGPHVMLGCYDEFRQLLRRLGTEAGFVAPRALAIRYRERGGRVSRLALSGMPVPLAMPIALAGLRGLRFADRVRALRGMVASLRRAPADCMLEDWLTRHGQQGGPRRFLWDPLCLAIMNAEAAEVSAELFLATLRRAFGGGAAKAAIWIPRQPWSRLLDEPAQHRLSAAGVRVRLRHRVVGVELRGDRVAGLRLGDGILHPIGAEDAVVSALPWAPLRRLLPGSEGAPAEGFEGRGIVNVYFDLGPAGALPLDGPLCALVDGAPFQFVYRRPGDAPRSFVVIGSASASLDGLGVDGIAAAAREQLAAYYPAVRFPDATTVRVTKEAAATVLTTPAAVARRPKPGRWPGLNNLWVCGDWTQTGLPSTLEGAAASAAVMIQRLGG